MEVYIKPVKKALLSERRELLIQDFCEISADNDVTEKIKKLAVYNITADKKTSFLVTAIDIVQVIKKSAPDAFVINVGESETLVDYSPVKSKDSRAIGWLKIIFVTAVLFMGSATAIMSFYTDAQLSTVFENMYFIIFGQRTTDPAIIEIPYCFGLAIGIIVFFNHVGGKRLSGDPTPIEVEMTKYEADVTDTMLDILNSRRREQEVGGDA